MKPGYYVSSFLSSFGMKIIQALVTFISVPLILKYYGKDQYGIWALALACNAYLHLLDFGINIGAIKYYAAWKAEKDFSSIEKVVSSSVLFYGGIGLLNTLVLLALAIWGNHVFGMEHDQFLLFRRILIVLSVLTIFIWMATPFNQLLIANYDVNFVNLCLSLAYLSNLVTLFVVIYYKLDLMIYAFMFTLPMALLFFPFYLFCRKRKLISSLKFRFYSQDFKIVFGYSLLIFILTLFQMTAANSRPLVLGMFAPPSIAAQSLAEFKIIEVFSNFIMMVGGVLTTILLPQAAKLITNKNRQDIDLFIYGGTKITAILCTCLCVPVILCSKELLSLYVGAGYDATAKWMALWVFGFLFSLHSTPCNSMVLANGKITSLIWVSGICCGVSVVLNALLCPRFNLGAPVIAYFVYTLCIMFYNYVWFYPHTLQLSRMRLFFTSFPVIFSGVVVGGAIFGVCVKWPITIPNHVVLSELCSVFIKSGAFVVIFAAVLLGCRIVSIQMIIKEIRRIMSNRFLTSPEI